MAQTEALAEARMNKNMRFSTPGAEHCFDAIKEAANLYPARERAEASGNLLAAALAESASNPDEAEEFLISIATAVARDLRTNWQRAHAGKDRLQ
jgi:hypothetical protein